MEWFNDHKYNNNLVQIKFESGKAILCFTDSVKCQREYVN